MRARDDHVAEVRRKGPACGITTAFAHAHSAEVVQQQNEEAEDEFASECQDDKRNDPNGRANPEALGSQIVDVAAGFDGRPEELVARTGIEPVVSALRGQRVKPITLPGHLVRVYREEGISATAAGFLYCPTLISASFTSSVF